MLFKWSNESTEFYHRAPMNGSFSTKPHCLLVRYRQMCSTLILLVLLTLTPLTEGDVKITYIVKNYANKDNLDLRLRKCESFNFLGDHCDPTFQFTAYTTNSRGERIVTMKREVGPFPNTRFIETVMEVSQIQQVFPDTIEFQLDINDSDADDDQQIALFGRKVPITKTGETNLQLGADVRVDVLIRVECAEEYYGDRCETYCQPYSGLWTCHEVTGARVCAKPCIHGSCVLTSISAVCVCASGWSGEFCKMPADSSLISSIIIPEMSSEPGTEALQEAETVGDTNAEMLSNVYISSAPDSMLSNIATTSSNTTMTTITMENTDIMNNVSIITVTAAVAAETTTTVKTNTSTVPVEESSNNREVAVEQGIQSIQTTPRILLGLQTEASTTLANITTTSQTVVIAANETVAADPITVLPSEKQEDGQTGANMNTGETAVKHAVGYSADNSSIYLIALTTISVAIIWSLLFVAVAFLIYRRRKSRKGSNHSGSIWTNTSYDLSPSSAQHSSSVYTPSQAHKYENTLSSYASSQTGSIRTVVSGPRSLGGMRGALPKLPTDEHDESESVRYTSPPVITGSKIRFAAPKVEPLPPKATELPCMTMTDPYDELTCLGDDYAVWEPENGPTAPLTSFK